MGNIIGESIPDYVGEQIKKRQEIYGSGVDDNIRTIEEISYLNSRTAWIKLASGTSMTQPRLDLLTPNNPLLIGVSPGMDLAEKNVLFGGISSLTSRVNDKGETIPTLQQRQGISGKDKAYGLGGNAFGFSPMPGIVDASINCLNNGSLKKAIINIKAHNKNQFNIIDVLYMRLGYTVLLEWGNSKYFTNPPNSFLESMGPTLIESQFFKNENTHTSYDYWLPEIENLRIKKSGNYDALFGVVSNFNWSFESDGTYNIQISLYTMGDVMESFKMNVPSSTKISLRKFLDSPQGENFQPNLTSTSEEFEAKFVDKETGRVKKEDAINAGYYWFDNSLDTVRLSRVEEKYQEANPGKNLNDLRLYIDTENIDDHWFFVLSDKTIYESAMGKILDPNIPTSSTSPITTKAYKKGDTYEKAIKGYTEVKKKEYFNENSETITSQVEKIQNSKLHTLLYQIREIYSENIDKNYEKTDIKKFKIGSATGTEIMDMGFILNKNEEIQKELLKLGLTPSTTKPTSDIIFTNISLLSSKDRANNAYYIRLGTLLNYIKNNVFMKIVQNNKFTPYLDIDVDEESNIMYTIPNQLSTDPRVCIISNSNFNIGNGERVRYWDGLEKFVGEIGNKITYGKVMNIYLNFSYVENLLASSPKLSTFTFLNTICNDLNSVLGGVNNLQPIINSESNKITIIDQTPLQGKEELIEKLGIPSTLLLKPNLEIYGYNPKNNTSNFVKKVGLKTEITKEYATMITIGATANGYVPGEEATAFSKWNIGIEDRFKKNLGDGSSVENDPVKNFESENLGVKRKYIEYLSKGVGGVLGINTEGPPYNINPITIPTNLRTVANFNKYIQTSASLSSMDSNAISSVGFLPFNLQLTLDGISGIKIYNKLEINQDFLPSNYPQSLEFIVVQANHKLLDNTWDTELETIGTSKTDTIGSRIDLKVFLKDLERIEEEVADSFSTNGVNANILRHHLKMLGYTEKGSEIDNGGDITYALSQVAEKVFKTIKKELPSLSIVVTGGNDAYHQNLKGTSRHTRGNGLDFVISPSRESDLDKVVGILEKFMFENKPNFRFIDEYRRTTEYGTGNHFHISWGAGTEAQSTLNKVKKKFKDGVDLTSYKIKI